MDTLPSFQHWFYPISSSICRRRTNLRNYPSSNRNTKHLQSQKNLFSVWQTSRGNEIPKRKSNSWWDQVLSLNQKDFAIVFWYWAYFRLVPKLKSLMFKMRFPEIVQDCKPWIVSVTAACQEIMRSVKFARILELILLIGNIMNTGSRLEQSVGFDISYLPKLSNTKDAGNKFTLLHFVVEKI